ncbi:MAG: magnesium-protoporphyrin IX monomethyl ester anaerobic oxidative cyclase [Hyphomicrobiaceae bacterium]
MKVLIVNPPHPSIGSRMPGEMLPPLGLLSVGGPLIDDGHEVALIDADVCDMALDALVLDVARREVDVLLIGHNGSTSAHPVVAQLIPMLRRVQPEATIVYGGVFPTYHWREVLAELPGIDVIVRGEGEETARRLMAAIRDGEAIETIPGLAFVGNGEPHATPPAPMITDLDRYRVGWELVDLSRYSYYGGRRGVVIQFSRGCPHLCSFCGQRGFWTRWRHRDPHLLAKEIAWLHRVHGVRMISFADENPTTSKKAWRSLLEALIAERLDLTMIATIRADDIVRDADMLHLYRKAGFERFLIGTENADDETIQRIRKGSSRTTDRQAIELLREHGILSLASWITGFEEEAVGDYWRAFRRLHALDPDQIITLYVTPHRWSPLYREVKERRVIQTDQRRWDYKHQVLENRALAPWQGFLLVKLIEVAMQARPKALWRTYLQRDRAARAGMRWYARIGRRVWLHEVSSFLFRDRRIKDGPTLEAFLGRPQEAEEEALAVRRGRAAGSRTPSQAAAAAGLRA